MKRSHMKKETSHKEMKGGGGTQQKQSFVHKRK